MISMMKMKVVILNNRQINEWVSVVVISYLLHNDLVQIQKRTISMNDGKIKLNRVERLNPFVFLSFIYTIFFSSLIVYFLFFLYTICFFFFLSLSKMQSRKMLFYLFYSFFFLFVNKHGTKNELLYT
jgi:hypothetical protein